MNISRLSGSTGIFGIFGFPIQHTLSPQMHLSAFEALNLDNTYLPFSVHPEHLRVAMSAIIPMGIRGLNITIPHKETVLSHLDEISPDAKRIGAVNTIEVSSGRLIGHNTDGRGFVKSLLDAELDPKGMSVVMLGTGGAAKGVAFALLDAGVFEIIILARRQEKGLELAKRIKAISAQANVSVLEFTATLPSTTKDRPVLLINTTPLGMKTTDPIPFPPEHIQAGWAVADLIYNPYETPLLTTARAIGTRIIPGLGMLLHQGALAFEIWTKQKPPSEVMGNALFKALKNLQ